MPLSVQFLCGFPCLFFGRHVIIAGSFLQKNVSLIFFVACGSGSTVQQKSRKTTAKKISKTLPFSQAMPYIRLHKNVNCKYFAFVVDFSFNPEKKREKDSLTILGVKTLYVHVFLTKASWLHSSGTLDRQVRFPLVYFQVHKNVQRPELQNIGSS